MNYSETTKYAKHAKIQFFRTASLKRDIGLCPGTRWDDKGLKPEARFFRVFRVFRCFRKIREGEPYPEAPSIGKPVRPASR